MYRRFEKNSFYLSVLLHALILLPTVVYWQGFLTIEKKPALYIPSYVSSKFNSVSETAQDPGWQLRQSSETSIHGIQQTVRARLQQSATSQSVLYQDRQNAPVQLVGDKKVAKPLLKLLGQALAAHLTYPKAAVDFRLRGTTLVGFYLQPDGVVTDVQLVRSSGAAVLDHAALAAATAISPVASVAQYVPIARFLVVGIIFG
jgi:TonB family protein